MINFKNILKFLSELEQNNTREWFNSNKDNYLQVKEEFDQIITKLIPRTYEIDHEIGSLEAKDCVFRIYRDVRFSKNKDPYKIHFGAYISKGGRSGKKAGYYLHIQPRASFIAAGVYMPEPEILKEIRYEIFENAEDFKKIIEAENFKKYFSALEGEKLKTSPKGFPKDFKDIELLKFKSYEISHRIPEEILLSGEIGDYIIKMIEIAYPLNRFMNKIIVSNTENPN